MAENSLAVRTEGAVRRKGEGKKGEEKHPAPEGERLCFAVACVDRNQMVSWNTRLAI